MPTFDEVLLTAEPVLPVLTGLLGFVVTLHPPKARWPKLVLVASFVGLVGLSSWASYTRVHLNTLQQQEAEKQASNYRAESDAAKAAKVRADEDKHN